MKKTFFLLLSLIMACGTTLAETRQSVLLLHEGTGRAFALDQLQQAVDAAEAGDTLYLNEGNYPLVDTLRINKEVSIIGTGTSTVLTGVVTISIPDSITLKVHLLDALRVTGNVRVKKPVNGVKFRKCTFDAWLCWDATTRDVEVDRCYVNGFNSTALLKSATVVNSRIYRENIPNENNTNFGNSVTFFNCSIEAVIFNTSSTNTNNYSTYINSIILGYSHSVAGYATYATNFKNSTFFNCLLPEGLKNVGLTRQNCYYGGYNTDWTKINGTNLSEDELKENGFLGNDGTVVGPEGGHAPYSLIPTGISVRESRLTIDGENRTLNVRLKLTAN